MPTMMNIIPVLQEVRHQAVEGIGIFPLSPVTAAA
jgi:hypothetical protein